jgi:hypothetical protein
VLDRRGQLKLLRVLDLKRIRILFALDFRRWRRLGLRVTFTFAAAGQ